jgi:hypothetical protein
VTPTAITPFSSPLLDLWDTLRAVIILLGLAVFVFGTQMLIRTELRGRILLTAALFAWNTASIGTEIQHLGDHVTYRLFMNLAGACLACWGMWAARAEP